MLCNFHVVGNPEVMLPPKCPKEVANSSFCAPPFGFREVPTYLEEGYHTFRGPHLNRACATRVRAGGD